MILDSPWLSLGPLFVFNVILLCTLFIFRPIYRKKERLKEVEERPASKFLNRWMREYWLWLTDPFVRLFARLHLSPNLITIIGVLLAVVSGLFFAGGHFGLGGWFMIFGATFDIFDGRVARQTNQVTESGAYFDSVMDRVSEGAVFMGLAFYYRSSWALGLVLLALLGSFMVSYTKAKADAAGVFYSGGAMQRPERIVYLSVGAIFAPLFGWPFLEHYPRIIEILYLFPLGFVALMTWVTSFDRMIYSMRFLSDTQNQKIIEEQPNKADAKANYTSNFISTQPRKIKSASY